MLFDFGFWISRWGIPQKTNYFRSMIMEGYIEIESFVCEKSELLQGLHKVWELKSLVQRTLHRPIFSPEVGCRICTTDQTLRSRLSLWREAITAWIGLCNLQTKQTGFLDSLLWKCFKPTDWEASRLTTCPFFFFRGGDFLMTTWSNYLCGRFGINDPHTSPPREDT